MRTIFNGERMVEASKMNEEGRHEGIGGNWIENFIRILIFEI